MDENTLNQFLSESYSKLSEQLGEEVSAQASAIIEDIKTKYLKKEDSSKADKEEEKPAEPTQAAEQDQKVLELQSRINQLETDNRLKDYNAYTETLISNGKLVPAQKDMLIAALEMGHKTGNTQFAENGKVGTKAGEAIIKQLVESFPKQIEFGEQATKDRIAEQQVKKYGFENMVVDEDMMELHVQVKNYMETVAKNGKEVSYSEALQFVRNNNK